MKSSVKEKYHKLELMRFIKAAANKALKLLCYQPPRIFKKQQLILLQEKRGQIPS